MAGLILWDFDGTLAHRPGMWSRCLLDVLDSIEPGHSITLEAIRPHMQTGFPWHHPETAHPELGEAAAWWRHTEGVMAAAYVQLGYPADRAAALAALAHERYLDRAGWQLFEDTLPVLTRLRGSGWRHVILSNHVPELPLLVESLDLDGLIDRVVTSAATGYEKPHPEAFRAALEGEGEPKPVWMVGDNPDADVRGAEAVGIPAILARTDPHDPAVRHARDLWAVAGIIDKK